MSWKTPVIIGFLLLLGIGFNYIQTYRTPVHTTLPDSIDQIVPSQEPMHTIYITGAVKKPGIYSIPIGTRVGEAIGKAGGLLPGAKPEKLNLAAKVKDGQRITVPSSVKASKRHSKKTPLPQGRISLNHATLSTLETLPNMSRQQAQNIADYRAKNGPFFRVEDLEKVTGIGKKSIEKWRPYVHL